MKTLLLITLTALGAVALTESFSDKPLILKQAKDELPETVVKTRKTNENTFNMALACTRDIPPGVSATYADMPYEYLDEDGEKQTTNHCVKCNAGVYALHEGAEFKTCTFCGEKE